MAYLFDTVKDPSILRRAGEMYMQRVIDPSRIAELTSLAVDAGGRDFTLKQIRSHLVNAENALSQAGIEPDDRTKLLALANDIGDVKQVDSMFD